MKLHRSLALGSIIILIAACNLSSQDNSASPQTAEGETPIRYVICSSGGGSCFVSARFQDFDGCESHKRWSGMLCDSKSTPGQMICRDGDDSIASAYCTK
jgi:hypothetical protein